MRIKHDNKVSSRRGASGFTLIEAVLALTLMIMLLSGVYGFYVTTLRARDVGSHIARDVLLAHSLLERMADEIRHTSDMVPGDGIAFSGTHDKLVVIRTGMPENYAFDKHDSKRDKLPPAQMDISRVTYELIWDDELTDDDGVKLCHGLLRSEQRTFDPNPKLVMKVAEDEAPPPEDGKDADQNAPGPKVMPVDRELVAPEIKYVRFEYFDGAEWRDRWQAQQGDTDASTGTLDHALPQAVRITLGHDRVAPEYEERDLKETQDNSKKKEFHPDRFTLVVYLHQADQSMLSSRKYGIKNNTSLQTGGGS